MLPWWKRGEPMTIEFWMPLKSMLHSSFRRCCRVTSLCSRRASSYVLWGEMIWGGYNSLRSPLQTILNPGMCGSIDAVICELIYCIRLCGILSNCEWLLDMTWKREISWVFTYLGSFMTACGGLNGQINVFESLSPVLSQVVSWYGCFVVV